MRSSYNETTKHTPYEVMHIRKPRFPSELPEEEDPAPISLQEPTPNEVAVYVSTKQEQLIAVVHIKPFRERGVGKSDDDEVVSVGDDLAGVGDEVAGDVTGVGDKVGGDKVAGGNVACVGHKVACVGDKVACVGDKVAGDDVAGVCDEMILFPINFNGNPWTLLVSIELSNHIA